jgi:hypothetical protein
VTSEGQLLVASLRQDVIREGGKVIEAEFLPAEIPKLGVGLGIIYVSLAILVASEIADPDVVALVDQYKRRRISVIADPGVTRVLDAVHE